MDVQTCYYEGDKLSERIAKYISRTTRANVRPHYSIDYTKPFIFVNSSNRHHNRTLEFVKFLSHINGYVHIDNHDDIAILSGASRVGPANFVESILALGKIVIFVGQNYWSHEVWFRGEKQKMLLRGNLQRYKPLNNIYFFGEPGPLVFCPMNVFEKIVQLLLTLFLVRILKKYFYLTSVI